LFYHIACLIPDCLIGLFSPSEVGGLQHWGTGFIRFEDSTAADKARAFAAIADEGGLTMKGHIVTLEPVFGKETTASLS
jgi:hypothetical protein